MTTYEAYWFLYDHPRFKCREVVLHAKPPKHVPKRHRLRKMRDSMPWNKGKTYTVEVFPLFRHAIQTNLHIHYALVDKRGRVNDDAVQNAIAECWLEFGPVKYEIHDGHLNPSHYHDVKLDCGAPTFDQALVKLARLVQKHYRANAARERIGAK